MMALFRRGTQPATGTPTGPANDVTDDRCAPAVGASWMQAPTLREAGTQTPLRGTSFHQGDIAPHAWAAWDAKPATDLLTVQLAVVPAGQWAGAVGVYAAGKRVASIAADAAEEYRAVVTGLAESGLPATARAVVIGGHARGTRGLDARPFGLALISSTHPAAAEADQPFLPPEMGHEATVAEDVAEALDAALPSRAKHYIRRANGHVNPSDGALVVDGQIIGRLSVSRPGELEPVRAAAAAGYLTTCLVRMIRAPQRHLRIMADLPRHLSGPASGLSFDLL